MTTVDEAERLVAEARDALTECACVIDCWSDSDGDIHHGQGCAWASCFDAYERAIVTLHEARQRAKGAAPAAHPVEGEARERLARIAEEAFSADAGLGNTREVWARAALAVRTHVLAGLRERAGGPLTMTVEREAEVARHTLVSSRLWVAWLVAELDATRALVGSLMEELSAARDELEMSNGVIAMIGEAVDSPATPPMNYDDFIRCQRRDLALAHAERDGLRAELETRKQGARITESYTVALGRERDTAVARCETLEAALRGVLDAAQRTNAHLSRIDEEPSSHTLDQLRRLIAELPLADALTAARAALTTARSEPAKTGEVDHD